jgi:hypothetical protein
MTVCIQCQVTRDRIIDPGLGTAFIKLEPLTPNPRRRYFYAD